LSPYSKTDARWMARALELAREGLGQTSPNPAVGAVIVREDAAVGEGFHTWAGVSHAETVALAQAGGAARGATLYVTLEPCSHQGRTGPCADEVVAAGIARVVVAMEDPNPIVRGTGIRRLRDAGLEVVLVDAPEAARLNEAYSHFMRTGRPQVTLKAALTLDGKIAAPEDNRGWITSEQAREHVQQVRHLHDAIVTGIGTVLADDCRLSDRSELPRSRALLRIVLDSQARLPLDSKMIEAGTSDLLVAATSAASPERRRQLEARGVEVAILDGADGRASLIRLVELLAARRYQSLMIEAGSKVNWAALESGVVDKVFFYYAPKILGGLTSLPVAGGTGRRRRVDAIQLRGLELHRITPSEFAVEAWVEK